jgi:flagellar hook assembly protein FlgD
MIKKVLFVLAITLTAFTSFAQKPEVISVKSPGDTSVLFTVKTVTYGGAYAPRHVLAIWITNSSNQHIRTLKVRAATYKGMLYKWKTYTSGVIPSDAISGASLTSHQTHTVAWNGKNAAGQVVPDGVYNLWVEFNETNFTGNPTTSIQFTKGPADQHVTPANTTYFQNIDLQYFYTAGYGDAIESILGNTSVTITPNPSTDEANIQMELKNNASVMVSIYSITGQMVHRFNKSTYSAGVHHFLWNPKSSNVASGTYFVHVNVDQKNQIFKLIIK